MRRIFCDIDDTLVHYLTGEATNPMGIYMGEPWEPNQKLIDAIIENKDKFDIYIWSGGGRDYAQMWGEKLLGDKVEWTALDKSYDGGFGMVRLNKDVVIDDYDFQWENHYFPNDLSWTELEEVNND